MIHVQATGQQFPGSVIRFSRDVSNATRTMLAEIDVLNPDLTLTPGMCADVTFALRRRNGFDLCRCSVMPCFGRFP